MPKLITRKQVAQLVRIALTCEDEIDRAVAAGELRYWGLDPDPGSIVLVADRERLHRFDKGVSGQVA